MVEHPASSEIDEYISRFPEATQEMLNELREIIRALVPEATETISYAIPTFDLDGVHLVHFAGYARHIGLYPTPSGMQEFADDLKPFKTGKGSVQFPLTAPLPRSLITRIVEYRIEQVAKTNPE